MRNWHHDWKTNIALRLWGAVSCGISCLAIGALIALHFANGQLPDGALSFILTAIGFLCASAGLVLLVLGYHIFDEVEISPLWQVPSPRDDGFAKADTDNSFEAQGARDPLISQPPCAASNLPAVALPLKH